MNNELTLVKCTWLSKTSGRSESYAQRDGSIESLLGVVGQCLESAMLAKGDNETLKIFVEVGTAREMVINVDGTALFDALNGGKLYCEFTRERLKDRQEILMKRESADAISTGEVFTEEVCGSLHSVENVKAHPPLGARASVEHGVEVVVIINAGEKGGS